MTVINGDKGGKKRKSSHVKNYARLELFETRFILTLIVVPTKNVLRLLRSSINFVKLSLHRIAIRKFAGSFRSGTGDSELIIIYS